MDSTIRNGFIDDIQKVINEDCSSRCFMKPIEKCVEKCFDSYLTAFNTTVKSLRHLGYQRNSRYIHLAYGEKIDEWDKIIHFNDMHPDILGYSVPYYESYTFNESKNK